MTDNIRYATHVARNNSPELHDTTSYVVTEPSAEFAASEPRVRVGTNVIISAGIHKDDTGRIVGYARGRRADRIHKALMAAAKAEGRKPGNAEYEVLIDNEGPLVQFTIGSRIEWFPGQAMGVLEVHPYDATIKDVERVQADKLIDMNPTKPLPSMTVDRLLVRVKQELIANEVEPDGLPVVVVMPDGEYRLAEVMYEEDLAGVLMLRVGAKFPADPPAEIV